MILGGQRHAPATLPPGKTRNPLYRKPVWTGVENFAPTGIQSPDLPVRCGYTSYAGHCPTNPKVACSIRDGINGIFHWHNLSGNTLALVSTQRRNECQEYLLERKGGRCKGLKTLPPSCADCHEMWDSQPLEPSEHVHASSGIALPRSIHCLARNYLYNKEESLIWKHI